VERFFLKNVHQTKRKIQFVSNSTYVISLPKQWIEATIGDNPDEVKQQKLAIIPMQDGSLAIYPEVERESTTFETSLQLGTKHIKNLNFFKKRLISKYLAGHRRILLTSDQVIPPELVKATEEIVLLLIGWEIAEINPNAIIIQDLLTPGQLPISQALNVMGLIGHSATTSSLHALVTQDVAMARKSSKLADKVKQYHYLITRQLKRVLANPRLLSEHGLKLTEIIEYHSAVQLLTMLSTHVVEVTTELLAMHAHPDFQELSDNFAFEKTLSHLKDINSKLTGISKYTIESFFERDEETAYSIIQTCTQLHPSILSLKRLSNKLPHDFALKFDSIGEYLSRIAATLCAICEIAINRAEPQ